MSATFGSYNIKRVIFHKETTFGVDESITWTPVGGVEEITARPILQFAENRNLTQTPGDHQLTRQHAEITLRGSIKRNRASPSWKWTDFAYYILATVNTGSVEDTIASLALAAQLDVATDQFKVWRGIKLDRVTISSRIGESVKFEIHGLAHSESPWVTADPVSGTIQASIESSGQAMHLFSNTNVAVGGQYGTGYSSIRPRLSDWSFTVERTLVPQGTDADDPTRWRIFSESEKNYRANASLDFTSNDEYNNYVNATKRSLRLTDNDGYILELTSGQWMTGELPIRSADLIANPLTFEATGARTSF